jgi:hypothetical protein
MKELSLETKKLSSGWCKNILNSYFCTAEALTLIPLDVKTLFKKLGLQLFAASDGFAQW